MAKKAISLHREGNLEIKNTYIYFIIYLNEKYNRNNKSLEQMIMKEYCSHTAEMITKSNVKGSKAKNE